MEKEIINMKKYFAKYLPVEGEIGDGDPITYIGFDGISIRHNKRGREALVKNGIHLQKMKLFLCSRDTYYGEPPIGNYIDSKIVGIGTVEATKIIGEISPEATWVKEGDEFDEDELDPYLYCLKHPDESFYFDEFNQTLEWIKLNPNPIKYKVVVKILGPCKHFH